MKKILLINGPNINLLGTREPNVYGHMTLADINHALQLQAKSEQFELTTFQSNHEGELIDRVHQARTDDISGIVINPAAYAHTSVALRDAFAAVNIPFVEVHLSNVYQRELFRQHSHLSDLAIGVIAGLGWKGYQYALSFLVAHTSQSESSE